MSNQVSAPAYFIGFIILSSTLLLYGLFQLIWGSGVLQWFMLLVINGMVSAYIVQRLRSKMEAVKNMRLLFTAMLLTALLLLAGKWFVDGSRELIPALLILLSVGIWFLMMILDRPKS